MFSWKRLFCAAFTLTLVALLLTLPGCFKGYVGPFPPGPEFTVDLSLSDEPELYHPIKVVAVFTMTEIREISPPLEITAEITLPDNFELVEGVLESSKSMSPGEILELEATIKAVEVCDQQKIEAVSYWSDGFDRYRGNRDTIFVYVFSDRAFWSEKSMVFGEEDGGNRPVQAVEVVEPESTRYMTLDLSLPDPPALGETAEVILKIIPVRDTPDVSTYIHFENGLELIQGENTWQGDLVHDKIIELRYKVKAVRTGVWYINVNGWYRPSPDVSKLDYVDTLKIYIFEDGAQVFHIPPLISGQTGAPTIPDYSSDNSSEYKSDGPIPVTPPVPQSFTSSP